MWLEDLKMYFEFQEKIKIKFRAEKNMTNLNALGLTDV